MKWHFRLIYSTVGILIALLLHGCQQKEEPSLDEKIKIAINSRKMPSIEKQNEIYALPPWIEERSTRHSKRLRNLEDYLPTIAILKENTKVTKLEQNLSKSLGQEILSSSYIKKETSLDILCEQKILNGIIVLHKGQIVYERYPDMEMTDRHNYFSISKSFLGTVISKLADEGKISEQDSIAQYLHEFRNKPLGKVSINNLLRMSSGINCREIVEGNVAFTDPEQCFYKYLQYLNAYEAPEEGFEQTLMDFFADCGVYEAAGTTYEYTSANTAILTAIAERVSGKPYHELVSEYIWSKIGAEDDARISLSTTGIPGSLGYMMSRLRDLARYGLAFTDDAPYKIPSDRYLKLLREGDRNLYLTDEVLNDALIFENQGAAFQSYHWDVVFNDGDFAKFGIQGQALYISPDKRLVVAFFSANKNQSNHGDNLFSLSRSIGLLEQFKPEK